MLRVTETLLTPEEDVELARKRVVRAAEQFVSDLQRAADAAARLALDPDDARAREILEDEYGKTGMGQSAYYVAADGYGRDELNLADELYEYDHVREHDPCWREGCDSTAVVVVWTQQDDDFFHATAERLCALHWRRQCGDWCDVHHGA
jgi:hypothetical protein